MEVKKVSTKKIRTSDDDKFIEELEKLIEKVKAGKVAHCEIRVAIMDEESAKKMASAEKSLKEAIKKEAMKILEDDDEEDEEECECKRECEDRKCDTPEDIFSDLGKAIGCMAYYELPLSLSLVTKYNKAFLDILTKDDDDEDS